MKKKKCCMLGAGTHSYQAEIRGIMIEDQAGQKVSETPFQQTS
jgi:hypothetical protein